LQYIQYSKLKRIINRRKFITDRDEACADESRLSGKMSSSPSITGLSLSTPAINSLGEYSILQSTNSNASYVDESARTADGQYVDDESDFFKVILSEIEKVNKFFVG
jgi:hypothetical protein